MLSTAFRCSLAFFFALGVVSAAQPTFYARQDVVLYIDSQQAQGLLVIADVNGDGILDLIGSPMLLGNGDGTFRTGPDLDIPDPELGAPVAFDTNGDGKVDLVYVSYQQSRLAVGVMLGNGDGTFEAPVYYLSTVNDGTTGPAGDALVSGDFNGDGITDVAVLGTAEIVVFMGSGTGAFVAGTPIQLTYNKIEDSIAVSCSGYEPGRSPRSGGGCKWGAPGIAGQWERHVSASDCHQHVSQCGERCFCGWGFEPGWLPGCGDSK